jgi:hypothetical protein
MVHGDFSKSSGCEALVGLRWGDARCRHGPSLHAPPAPDIGSVVTATISAAQSSGTLFSFQMHKMCFRVRFYFGPCFSSIAAAYRELKGDHGEIHTTFIIT